MQVQHNSKFSAFTQEEETNTGGEVETNENAPNVEDTDPPVDEEDLEENDLTVEEADKVVWDEPKKGSSGSEEKDITD